MNRKTLIVVTILFLILVGSFLVLTLSNLDEEKDSLKPSITGSTTYESKVVVINQVDEEDYILKGKCN